MFIRRLGWISLVLALLPPALLPATARAAEKCTLRRFAVPVTMDGTRPLISATINGKTARFVVDTGAFFQMISPAVIAASQPHLAGLAKHLAPIGLRP